MTTIFFPSKWDAERCERELEESNFVNLRWGIYRGWDGNAFQFQIRAEAWPLVDRCFINIDIVQEELPGGGSRITSRQYRDSFDRLCSQIQGEPQRKIIDQ